jgi:hypothetical protein
MIGTRRNKYRDVLERDKCVLGGYNDNYLVTKFECQNDN